MFVTRKNKHEYTSKQGDHFFATKKNNMETPDFLRVDYVKPNRICVKVLLLWSLPPFDTVFKAWQNAQSTHWWKMTGLTFQEQSKVEMEIRGSKVVSIFMIYLSFI